MIYSMRTQKWTKSMENVGGNAFFHKIHTFSPLLKPHLLVKVC